MSGSPTPRKLSAKALAEQRLEEVREAAAGMSDVTLVTVLVGEDPASAMYVGMKQQEAKALGIASRDVRLPADITQAALEDELRSICADDGVDAVLVQYPLPKGLDFIAALLAMDPGKDVDGLHPVNLGLLAAGRPAILPCTPRGIVDLLQHHEVPVAGARVAMVGRGLTVGRPLSMLLSDKSPLGNATVTVLHTGTRQADLVAELQAADIVIAAAGAPRMIQPEWIRPGAVLVAAGVSFPEGKAVSDFAPGCREVAAAFTPTTGGVGPMTRAWLFQNVIECRRRRTA